MFWRIIIGILIMVVGFTMVWKTEKYLGFFGRIPWAERKFAYGGGSRIFYKLLGIIITFIGLFVATNLIGGIINKVFGSLFSSLA